MSGSGQYFEPRPDSASSPVRFSLQFEGRGYVFTTDAGVFSRSRLDAGTRALLRALPERMPGRVLDLGCGWGAMGVLIAGSRPEARVWMSDVNERAVALAEKNARVNGVDARAVLSDGVSALAGGFDWIVFNPPLRAGKELVRRLFREAGARLLPGGSLFTVIRRRQGAESALRFLKEHFVSAAVADRSGGYWVIICTGGTVP